MTPNTLAIIGASLTGFASLSVAIGSTQSKFLSKLSLVLPIGLSGYAAYFSVEKLLNLWGHSTESDKLLSLTLQYDQPEKGVAIIDQVMTLAHPYQSSLSLALVVTTGLSVLSLFPKKPSLSRTLALVSSGAWLSLWLIWLLSHSQSFMGTHSGETAVRQFIKLSALDSQRVLQFVVPDGTWRYGNQSWSLIVLSVLSAMFVLVSNLTQTSSSQESSKAFIRELIALFGSFLCVGAALWSSLSYGFSGSTAELALWLSAILVGSASATWLKAPHRGLIAMLASLVLVAVL